MYLNFELKKLWKRKILLALMALAFIVSIYTNFVLVKDQERRDPEYTFKEDFDPFLNLSMAVAPYRYMTIRSFQEDITLGEEFIGRWDALSELENKLYGMKRLYAKQIHRMLGQPRNYAYPDNLDEFEQIYVGLQRDLLEFVRDYEDEYSFVSLSDADERYLEWLFASYEKSQETGDHLIGLSSIHYNANLVQRFLFQSRFTLGLPFIISFLLLFMSIYSGEKEQGTLELLHMQPLNRRRVIFAKLTGMMLAGLLYFMMLLFFMGVIALVIGLPIDGFTEVYRVFTPDQSLAMLTGAQLFFRVFVSFMLMVLFFSTLLLMISTRTGRISLTMAILFVFLGLNYVLLEVVPTLKNAYHPLYQLDYLKIHIGQSAWEITDSGGNQRVVFAAEGIKPYLALCIPSLIFLGISMYPVIEQRSKISNQRPAGSFLSLEMKKIWQAQSFGYYLVGGALLLGIFFVTPLIRDAKRIEVERSDTSSIQSYEELIEAFEKQNENRGKDTEDDGRPTVGIDYQAEMEKLNAMQAKHEALFTGDSKTYYENATLLFGRESMTYIADGIVGGEPSEYSSDETMAILLKAAEIEDPLVPMGGSSVPLQFSARENYVSRTDREMWMRDVQPSHSVVFWPYRLLSRHNLDVILLLAMAVIAFAGYTLDKEEGNQLEFLMTQPLSKSRMHLTKLTAGMLMSALFASSLLVFAALCGLLTEGIGAYHFPIVFYAGSNFSLIPLWQYLLMILGALLFQAFFLNTLMLLLSVMTRNRVQLLGLTALIMGAGIATNGLLPQGWIKTLSPFNYFEASDLANQAIRYYNAIPQASYGLGLAVLGVFGFIFILIGMVLISRQQSKPMA